MKAGREGDFAQQQAVRAQQKEALREAVARQVRAGRTDTAISRVLSVGHGTVTRVRKELGLPANKEGGS